MKIVYTGGTFDVLHIGHVNFLRKCAKIGRVVVALNTDDFIERFKGKRPLYSFEERRTQLLSLPEVDQVVSNDGEEDSKPTILKVKPNFIVAGSDWAKKDYYKQMSFTQDWLDQHGIVLLFTPYYEGISSSDIKRRMA